MIWLWWYQVLLKMRMMFHLIYFLEPNLNIYFMSLVCFFIWIIIHVFFYHDIQIFLFFFGLFSWTHGWSNGKHEGTFSISNSDVLSSSSVACHSLGFSFESSFPRCCPSMTLSESPFCNNLHELRLIPLRLRGYVRKCCALVL